MVERDAKLPSFGRSDPAASVVGFDGTGLDLAVLPDALAMRDWLLAEASRTKDLAELLAGFARGLNALGVPIHRMTTAIDALHSEYSGIGRFWTLEEGASTRLFPHGPDADRLYAESPFAQVHRTREWLLLDLAHTPDDLFGVIPDLKAAGYRHYLVVPIFFTHGSQNGVTFATRDPNGFPERGLKLLRFVMPTLSFVLEARSTSLRLDNVLRIYVGDEPHRAILSGTIRRGQVSRIRSAILFADMRGYTRHSATLPPEAAVELLNAFFDCLVPPIEAEGGEVLKYLGDGLLAIFREPGDDSGRAAEAALTAATVALGRLRDANDEGRFPHHPVEAGIALHHGQAAYGNVGSGARLDFTVIGPDVNLASRIAELNRTLGEPLLMSKAFVNHLWGDPEPLGSYQVDGVPEAVPVYRPARGSGST